MKTETFEYIQNKTKTKQKHINNMHSKPMTKVSKTKAALFTSVLIYHYIILDK
jgi:hypothetical protein